MDGTKNPCPAAGVLPFKDDAGGVQPAAALVKPAKGPDTAVLENSD